MSFREKTAWASLAITLLVFVPYFAGLFAPLARGEYPDTGIFGRFLAAVAIETVLMVVAATALALFDREEPADERDRAVDARAHRYGYYVLATTCAAAMLGMVGLGALGSGPRLPAAVVLASLSQLVLLCLILAEVVRTAVQIVGYRRGA